MEADSGASGAAAGASGRPRDRYDLAWHVTEQVQSMDQRRAVMTGHGSGARDRQGGGDPQSVLTCFTGRALGRDERRRRVDPVAQPEECTSPDQAAYLAGRCPRGGKLSRRHHTTNPRTAHPPTIPGTPDIPSAVSLLSSETVASASGLSGLWSRFA